MSAFLNQCAVSRLNPLKPIKPESLTRRDSPRLGLNSVRCESTAAVAAENRRVTLSNGNDSLDICRVLNGMWQTSGGWGRIDRDAAVVAMLRYADTGLTTFDMADHCKFKSASFFLINLSPLFSFISAFVHVVLL